MHSTARGWSIWACTLVITASSVSARVRLPPSGQAPQVGTSNGPSPAALEYLNQALALMQTHALSREDLDWSLLRRTVVVQAGGAQTPVDTYPAIRLALAMLGDHHSYLQLSPALAQEEALRKPTLTDPTAMPKPEVRAGTFPFPSPFRTRRVPEGAMVVTAAAPIAQVVEPLFASASRQELDEYATRVQQVIRTLTVNRPCAWIVDLRGNGGGNIWPMLAGLGPLLGDGTLGGRVDRDRARTDWFYEAGAAGERTGTDKQSFAQARDPVVLTEVPPVAVLIDRDTGSSAEGVALAFRGRPDTRFFGERTFGAASSTFPYPLSDGAQLYLVTATMVDRNGIQYPSGIAPDEEVLSEATITTADPVIRAASAWLSARPPCGRRP